MTQLQLLQDWSGWLLNIITWSSFAFPVVTRLFWNWIESWWGRNLVAFELCLGLGFIGATMQHDWHIPSASHGGMFYFFAWLQTASLSFVPVITLWRTILIWKRQRTGAIAQLAEDIANGDKAEKDTI